MQLSRSSGILLHPTSLPGRYGIGDLGHEAYRFVDFLAATGQQIWQILPLGPTGYGNSPYLSYSSMAGNQLLISLDILKGQGWLQEDELAQVPDFPLDRVDYDEVGRYKIPLLEKAAKRFKEQASSEEHQAFAAFCESRDFWLDEYALYMALKRAHDGASWFEWDEAIARRDPQALQEWRSKLTEETFYDKFLQFEFFRQWSNLKHYANERGIQIVGDMPFYVAHDSVDVWGFPHNFCIDPDTLQPSLMAGVPPDYFSATGQLWGNPVYDWEVLQQRGFHWWIQRLRAMLEYVDFIRIDHFRGFEAYWAVPGGETTAMNGEWVKAPGEAFFEVVRNELGSLPILAEDLGVITPEVEELRDKFDFPGMKVLQFAFGSGADNPYLPFNYPRNCVVYTGTHDNDTTVGWWHNTSEDDRRRLWEYLGCMSDQGIHWDLIRVAFRSVANCAIVPLQDFLGLGSEARMNTPGQPENNWAWRYRSEVLTDELRDRLCHYVAVYGRVPHNSPYFRS
jgi:4-alpha-glucanotransferase